jgi:hypothetical protein
MIFGKKPAKLETGVVDGFQLTFGGAGNQWTTINGKRYATWWNALTMDWKVGDTVTFRPYKSRLWSDHPPIDCADQIHKVKS